MFDRDANTQKCRDTGTWKCELHRGLQVVSNTVQVK